jgi:hypothetical protein
MQMPRQHLLGALAALAIAGPALGQTAGPPGSAPPPVATSFREHGYHCPPAGTVVEREVAGETYSVIYGGNEPGDPEACLAPADAKLTSYYFGLINKHGYRAADFVAAYRKVLLGPPGTVAEFQFTPRGGGNYDERYENEALETLQVGGQARPSVRVSVTERKLDGAVFELNYHRWFDVQTGALIRQTYRLVSGKAPSNARQDENWAATSVTVPQQ